jgi:SPP1 gp7 family putative phage head morphogenesis protein
MGTAARAASLTRDARPGTQKPPKLGRAQRSYERALSSIARHAGELIEGVASGSNWLEAVPTLRQLLDAYATALIPWATATARSMLNEVDARDRESWRSLGGAISVQLRNDILRTPVGERMRELLAAQVGLIRSIPTDAANRVHELTLKGLENSERASTYVAEIMRSGEVAKSHAQNIAVTEVARTASVLTQVRAESAGSSHYRWRTSLDSAVREDHRILEGKVFAWNAPPIADRRTGARAAPGRIYRCRCWPEAIIDDPY